MTFTGQIAYAGESKHDARRLVVQLRIPVVRRRGDVVDFRTGKYLTFKDVPGYRDEFFYVDRTSTRGDFLASACERHHVRRNDVTLTATYGPGGWAIGDIEKAEIHAPEFEEAS